MSLLDPDQHHDDSNDERRAAIAELAHVTTAVANLAQPPWHPQGAPWNGPADAPRKRLFEYGQRLLARLTQ